MKAIIGRKVGMTEVFAEDGTMYPVTVVEVLPNIVTQVKTIEKDGYNAIQVGYEEKKESRANKPEKGIAAKANTVPHQFLRELKGDEMLKYQVGDQITVDIFKAGDIVDVIGTSKGKGFQGVVKRYGFRGVGGQTHGQEDRLRAPGSLGAASFPSRVFRGKRMAGHMGNERVKILNLEVIKIIPENNILVVKGSVPGARGSYVFMEG